MEEELKSARCHWGEEAGTADTQERKVLTQSREAGETSVRGSAVTDVRTKSQNKNTASPASERSRRGGDEGAKTGSEPL